MKYIPEAQLNFGGESIRQKVYSFKFYIDRFSFPSGHSFSLDQLKAYIKIKLNMAYI